MARPKGISNCTMCVELSTDGTTWTDFSEYLTVITPDAWTRNTGSMAVFTEARPVRTSGLLGVIPVTIRGVYDDATATTNPFRYCWNQHTQACSAPLAVRWAPVGCATDNQVFSTATATTHSSGIISLTVPAGDASSADPLVWEAVIEANGLSLATYA